MKNYFAMLSAIIVHLALRPILVPVKPVKYFRHR